MTQLRNAVESLAAVVLSDDGDFNSAMDAARDVLELAGPHPDSELLRLLVPAIEADDPERAGIAATVAGALVERGGDAAQVGAALVSRLREVVDMAERYVDACREHFYAEVVSEHAAGCEVCGPGNDEPGIMAPEVRAHVREAMPEGESAWVALDLFCRPAVTVLTRLPALRREGDAALVLQLGLLAQFQSGPYFVFALLSVLEDEKILVLSPAERRGFEVRISGIADNFQLQLLLADALIGGGHLDGEAPDAALVAVADGSGPPRADDIAVAAWNLFNWTALRGDGSLPDGYFDSGAAHLIFNEGIPADIADVDGTRIVLIAPTPYLRSWTPTRMFEGLAVSLRLEREMEATEVATLLDELSAKSASLRAVQPVEVG